MNITEFREKYPQYSDMGDQELAEAKWKKDHPTGDVSYMEYASKFLFAPTQALEYPHVPAEEEEEEFVPDKYVGDHSGRTSPKIVGGRTTSDYEVVSASLGESLNTTKRWGMKAISSFNHGVASLGQNLKDVGGMIVNTIESSGYDPLLAGGMEYDKEIEKTLYKAKPTKTQWDNLKQAVSDELDAGIAFYVKNAAIMDAELEANTRKHGQPNKFHTGVENVVGGAVGGAIPGIGEFMMGVPWATLVEATKDHETPAQAMKDILLAGAERYAVGKVFHYTGDLNRLLKTSVMGSMFGAQTYAHTGDMNQALESVGVGFIYGMTGPAGTSGLKELRADPNRDFRLKEERAQAEAKEEVGKKWKEEGVIDVLRTDRFDPVLWDFDRVGEIQEFDSADTSINQSKMPASIKAIEKLGGWVKGQKVIDIGGGRFDNVVEYLGNLGVKLSVYDPFNRDAKHNRKVANEHANGQADVAISNNTLNVIKEGDIRERVIMQAANAIKADGKAYFSVYEGKGDGYGAETSKGWQNNRKTADYVAEVGRHFNRVTRKGQLIIAEEPIGLDQFVPRVQVNREHMDNSLHDFFTRVNDGEPAIPPDGDHLNIYRYDTAAEVGKGIEKALEDNLDKAYELGSKPETHAETIAKAQEDAKFLTGKTMEELATFARNTDNLAAKLVRWRAYTEGLSSHVLDLAGKALEAPTEVNLLKFYDKYRLMGDVVAYVKGATSNIARATASGNIRVNGQMFKVADLTPEMMDAAEVRHQVVESVDILGGLERVRQVAKEFTEKKGTEARLREAEKISKSHLMRAIVEYRTANLLSSKNTFMVNMESNILRSAYEIGEDAIGWAIGKARNQPGRMKSQELAIRATTFASGMLKYYLSVPVKGVVSGIKFSAQNPGQAFKNFKEFNYEKWSEDISLDPLIRTQEVGKETAFNRENLQHSWVDPFIRLGQHPESSVANAMYKGVDALGKGLRSVSFAPLNMMDAVQKTIIVEMEAKGLAMRKALDMGKEPKEAVRYANEVSDILLKHLRGQKQALDPLTKEFIEELAESTRVKARELVWQAELGEGGKGVTKLLNQFPSTKFIIPFFRTPLNIAKFAGSRTPLANFASKKLRDGLRSQNPIEQNKALAQLAVSFGIYTITSALVASMDVTGSHDPSERSRLIQAGIPEYSIKINGEYYQYNRNDPFGMFLGLTADMATMISRFDTDEGWEIMQFFLLSFSNNLLSKTYLKGVQDIAVAVADEGARLPYWTKSFGKTFLPASGAAGSVNDMIDPHLREVQTFVDMIKQTYASTLLEQKLDWMGEPVEKYSWGYRMATGAKRVTPDTSPSTQWFDDIGLPTKRTPKEVLGVELTPEQKYEFKRILGEKLKMKESMNELAKEFLSSEKRYPNLERQVADKVINAFYKIAKGMLLEDETFSNEYIRNKVWDTQRIANEVWITGDELRRQRKKKTRDAIGKPSPPKEFMEIPEAWKE